MPDNDDFERCPKCGSTEVHRQECWNCGGEGGFHDCGEDCCCCLDKEEITVDCNICKGNGSYLICEKCIRLAKADERRNA
jgi:hypothetical protein